MQRQKASLFLGALLLVIAVILTLLLRSHSGENDHAPKNNRPPVKSARSQSPSSEKSGRPGTAVKSDPPLGNPEENEASRERILEEIQNAAVSYNAAQLPKIEPYLLHPDQEIRQAAVNGMITLGDGAAAPLLRKAAALAPTPQEAAALIEAADYVELPPAKWRLKSK